MKKIKDPVYNPATGNKVEPAIWKCSCGRELTCEEFTNTCECGKDYNWNGTLLASREQWGEETAESLSDILQIK